MTRHSRSVVIPTFNAEKEIGSLLEVLLSQTLKFDEILVVDSSSSDETVGIVKKAARENYWANIRLKVIPQSQFDHGGTRKLAFEEAIGDFVYFLTQDAVPLGVDFTIKMEMPFVDDRVAIVTGRQVAKPDANRAEQLTRQFNYPNRSFVRSQDDLERCGIKTYFTSDVCSAYRRAAYEEVGGFPEKCNTSEDMYVAIRATQSGWKIAYNADARVAHSHNLRVVEQYRRNLEVGYFLESQAEVLKGISEVGEGIELVKYVLRALLKEGHVVEAGKFCVGCLGRLAGNRAGRMKYRKERGLA